MHTCALWWRVCFSKVRTVGRSKLLQEATFDVRAIVQLFDRKLLVFRVGRAIYSSNEAGYGSRTRLTALGRLGTADIPIPRDSGRRRPMQKNRLGNLIAHRLIWPGTSLNLVFAWAECKREVAAGKPRNPRRN
jgi:hypothetical protein